MAYHANTNSSSNTTSTAGTYTTTSTQKKVAEKKEAEAATPIEHKLFNYTNGEILELNGETYTGYYNVTNNNFYSGRKVTSNSSFLTIKDNALGNFYKSKFYFNRIPTEDLVLPSTKKDVLFDPGEYINQNSINEKLIKLNNNYLELFNLGSIQTNDLPENFVGFIGASAQNDPDFGLNTVDTAVKTLENVAENLRYIRRIEVVPTKLSPTQTNPDSFLSIYASTSGLYAFNCPNIGGTTYTFRASSVNVDGLNTRNYNFIADITTNNKDLLYVSDTAHNQIYRIYIDPLVNDSRITGADREYLQLGGAEINTMGNGILSGAVNIEYSDGELFTYNTGTKSFVVLDKDLTFKRRFTSKELKDNETVSFAVNAVDKNIYALMDNYKIIKIPIDFKQEISTITLDNTFNPIDEPRKIFFSKNNSNIYYVMTRNNLYKYFNEGPNVPIGLFDWRKTNVPDLVLSATSLNDPDDELVDTAILEENNNYDSLFILEKNLPPYFLNGVFTGTYTNTGLHKILRCNETNDRIKLLENEVFRSFDLNDILVNDQYFNSLTLNKSFKKLIFNMDILASYLQSKFLLTYNTFNDLTTTGRVPLTATPIINKEYDMFVGPNEVLTPQVLNRCVGKIIDRQEYLLSVLQGKPTNKKFTTTEIAYIAQ